MSKLYIGNKLVVDPDIKLEKVELTQAEYDSLSSFKDNVLYVITDAPDPLDSVNSDINTINKILTQKIDKAFGNKEDYDAEEYVDTPYYATDTNEILFNSQSYGGNVESIPELDLKQIINS